MATLPDDLEIWDMVFQPIPELDNGWDRLARYRAAGVTHVSITLAGDNERPDAALEWVARARREILSRPEELRLVHCYDDIAAARQANRLACSLHFEGTECFGRNLDLVEVFHRLGVRQTLIAFNRQNSAGSGCAEPQDGGLSSYGKALLAEMERVGMLVDLSHVGRRTSLEVMERCTRPPIFSHSNPSGLFRHFRNIDDEQAVACAQLGGVVGVSGSTMYMDSDTPSTDMLYRQVDYYVSLLGVDHVGLGLDTFFDGRRLEPIIRARPDEWPGMETKPLRYATPDQIRPLAERMLGAGYDEPAIRAILAGNFARVCRAVWN